MILVALAGLPGSGKSSVATLLATELRAPLLSKDVLRDALFGPRHVAYDREQDDFCVEQLYRTAGFLAERGERLALLDGRCYLRRSQVDRLREAGTELGFEVLLVELACPTEQAIARVQAQGPHAARDRDTELVRRLAREAEPLEGPDLRLDSGACTPAELAAAIAAHLDARP